MLDLILRGMGDRVQVSGVPEITEHGSCLQVEKIEKVTMTSKILH